MPNTFIDNREAWLRLSEIDYLGQFTKVWLAFNAWYRNAYSEGQDRKIINEFKSNSNPVGNVLRPMLETQSEEAKQFRSDIGLLHHRLEHYEIRTGKGEEKQRITFKNVFIRDRPPGVETENSYGYTFKVERKANGEIETTVLNRAGSNVLNHNQRKYDLDNLVTLSDFQNLRQNQCDCLRNLYKRSSPKEVVDLTASSGSSVITCGSYSFYCSREDLFAAIVEVVYLMRCHMFHGELAPTRQASECYEPAFRIVRRFLNHVT